MTSEPLDVAVRQSRSRARTDREWSAARVFMLLSAIWHIPLGIIGLAIDRTFPVGVGAARAAHSEHIFGVFETNGWHSSAALLLGFVSVYFLVRPRLAAQVALGIGLFHVGIVLSLELWSPETFWLASNMADQIVHASTAVSGIAAGLVTRSRSDVQGVQEAAARV